MPRGAAALVALAATLAVTGALAQVAKADEAAQIYEPATVNVIRLGLSEEAEEALEADPQTYVKGTFSMATTDGTPGGEEHLLTPNPVNVEIRLKGDSSFEPLEGKAAFKLKFKKSERFLGLRKMTLNNMVEDTSMIHETLAYDSFRAAGVPASRTSFAYVYVNGEDFGIELNIETVDVDLLEKHFGPFDATTQHLYEGEDGADAIPGDAEAFEADEGEEGDLSDLEALISAVNSTGTDPWATRVAPFIDLREMTSMWAVEKYVGHWDGYAGATGEYQPSNYYLYSSPAGEFQMIPWGSDETFEEEEGHLAFDGTAGVMFNLCLEDPPCVSIYRESLQADLEAIEGQDLGTFAGQLAELLAPWQEMEQANERHLYEPGEIESAVTEVEEFLASRPQEAEDWLTAHVPPETTIESAPSGTIAERGPSISFSSSESGSSFECRLDAAAFAPCSSPDALAGLADGPHSFEVRASDSVGNTDPSPAVASFSVDATPPETTITGKPAAASRDRTPRFRFASSEAGSRFECSIDSKPFRPCHSPKGYGKLKIGKHRFRVRAVDGASNVDPTPAEAKFAITGKTKRAHPARARLGLP